MTQCIILPPITQQSVNLRPSTTLKCTICSHVLCFSTLKSTICGHITPFSTMKSTICGRLIPLTAMKSSICGRFAPLIALRRVCIPHIHRQTSLSKPHFIFLSSVNGIVYSKFHTFVYPYITIHLNNEHRKRITVSRYTGNCSII